MSWRYMILFMAWGTAVLAQINTEKYRQDNEQAGLSGHIDLSAQIITGNTDYRFYTMSGRLNQNWGKAYTFLVVDGGMGRNKGQRFMDQALTHFRHVIALGKSLQHETFAQKDFNKKRNLSDRIVFGSGLRLRVMKTEAVKLRAAIAYMFEREWYTLSANDTHQRRMDAHRISSYVTLEYKLEKNVSLIAVTYFQPEILGPKDNRVLSESALVVKLGPHLDLQNSLNLRFDSRPPTGVKKTDMTLKTGLSVRF